MFKLLKKERSRAADSDGLVFVKRSPVQGRGLFTWRPVAKGTIIFKLTGSTIRQDYSPEFSKEGPNWIGTGFQQWILSEPNDNVVYLNHSCEPNVIFSPEHKLISLTPIDMFQELLLDYSTTELDPYWEMPCKCGAANCRKIIRAFQFLPSELKQKYLPLLHPHFSGKY